MKQMFPVSPSSPQTAQGLLQSYWASTFGRAGRLCESYCFILKVGDSSKISSELCCIKLKLHTKCQQAMLYHIWLLI